MLVFFICCISFRYGHASILDNLLKQQTGVIEELIYSCEMPPVERGGTNRVPTKHYLLRWESPETYLLAEALHRDDLTRIDGKYEGPITWYCATKEKWWYLELIGDKYVAHVWDTSTPREECCNGVYKTVDSVRLTQIEPVLGAGLPYLYGAQVSWIQDAYYFTNQAENVTGSGKIALDSLGRTKRIDHVFDRNLPVAGKSERRTFRHRIEYDYQENLKPAGGGDFPLVLNIFVDHEHRSPFHYKKLTLHNIKLARTGLSEEQLHLESAAHLQIAGKRLIVYVVSNKTEYAWSGKKWSPLIGPDHPTIAGSYANRSEHRTARKIWIGAMLLTSIVFGAFWFLRTTSRNKPNKS